jgi:hypothetical protein
MTAADSFPDEFVTAFTFASTLIPALCPSCAHSLANHIYIGKFTAVALPDGDTAALPTHGTVLCRLDDCNGSWDLSVLTHEDTLLILPPSPSGDDLE